ncbi:MAG: phosphoribosylglycinamide formyltransferase [Bacteroidota bacterium]
MFKRLQEKWGVSTRQFWILFIVFGLTGTTTAILTRYITLWLGVDASSHWALKLGLRLGMLVFGYQVILLIYGALLGQWAFFWKYEKKLLKKLGVWSLETEVTHQLHPANDGTDSSLQSPVSIPPTAGQSPVSRLQSPDSSLQTKKIAIFASGTGTNAEKIITHLKNHSSIQVVLVVCNKPGAGVLSIAAAHRIPTLLIEKEPFFRGDAYLPALAKYGVDFIVLAGFLWKVPDALVVAFPKKIINIHPALLPKYGGKGMYGMHVHEAVIAAGEKESGITIHYVNEHFDEGEPIFQASCVIEPADTPETLAQKVHALEHRYFPEVVEKAVNAV